MSVHNPLSEFLLYSNLKAVF